MSVYELFEKILKIYSDVGELKQVFFVIENEETLLSLKQHSNSDLSDCLLYEVRNSGG